MKKLMIFIILISLLTACSSINILDRDALSVHIINVGQGDAILLKCGSSAALVDSGPTEGEAALRSYIKKQGIKKLDFFVATHPHNDHIGNAAYILRELEVKEFFISPMTNNTSTYHNMLKIAGDKGIKPKMPKPGDSYKLGKADIKVLGPVKKYEEEINDNSIVLRVSLLNNSFLLTGDAESKVLKDIADTGAALESDVLKVGHHGSKGSVDDWLLNAVKPKYAAITCEAGNDYNHPNIKTTKLLSEHRIKLYRTDKNGSIVFTTDGKRISVKSEEDKK